MPLKETVKRYILFIASLFFSALGVAIMKKCNLGISPMSSVANVLSIKFDFITLGKWLIVWNCLMILLQIIIRRKDFQLIQLLQLPLSFIFGYFIDFSLWIVSALDITNYILRICFLMLGITILAFGISLAVIANVIMNSGEAFVKAISDTTKKDFGKIKSIVDIGCVTLATILSLVFFNFKIMGIREGTIIVALCTGPIVRFFTGKLHLTINNILSRQ